MIWPTGAIGLDLSCPDGWHGFSESTSCYMWDNYDHYSSMRWWCLRKTITIFCIVWNGKSEKGSIKASLPPFCNSHSNYVELMTMMTMKTILKMMKVLKVVTITTTHTGFWMIISRAGTPVKNIARTGEQVSCILCFVHLYFGICVYLYFGISAFLFFCISVHMSFGIFVYLYNGNSVYLCSNTSWILFWFSDLAVVETDIERQWLAKRWKHLLLSSSLFILFISLTSRIGEYTPPNGKTYWWLGFRWDHCCLCHMVNCMTGYPFIFHILKRFWDFSADNLLIKIVCLVGKKLTTTKACTGAMNY